MKKIICLIYFLCMGILAFSQEDLKAETNQTAFDEVLNSVKYPFTMFQHTYPFKSVSVVPAEDVATRTLSKDSSILYFQWAVENGTRIPPSSAVEVDNEFREALQMEWESMRAGIQEILDEHNSKIGTPGYRFPLQGYTPDELARIQKANVRETIEFFSKRDASAFIIRAHLAYLRVDLNERPSLTVTSPTFAITGIKVKPTATGELWVKVPVFRCCPLRITWKWKRTLTVSVSPSIAANAKVTFAQSHLKVVGKAQFTRLVLDYPILREINLARIANRALKEREFEVIDASAFVACLPYINSRFRIESLALPPNQNGLTVVVNIVETEPTISIAGAD